MKTVATADKVPQHLLSTYQLILAAYPSGIEADDYFPLLNLLEQNLSDRNLAEVIAQAFGIDLGKAMNDLYRARSTEMPTADAIDRVKRRLHSFGYDAWLNEE